MAFITRDDEQVRRVGKLGVDESAIIQLGVYEWGGNGFHCVEVKGWADYPKVMDVQNQKLQFSALVHVFQEESRKCYNIYIATVTQTIVWPVSGDCSSTWLQLVSFFVELLLMFWVKLSPLPAIVNTNKLLFYTERRSGLSQVIVPKMMTSQWTMALRARTGKQWHIKCKESAFLFSTPH